MGTNNNIAKLTFSGANPNLTVSGAVTVGNSGNANRRGSITFTSGSTLIAGSLRLGAVASQASVINMTNGGILQVGGTITAFSGTTWTPGTGTVVLTATNTLPATIFTTFNNLSITGGTTTTGCNLTIGGNLDVGTGSAFATAPNYTLGVTGTTSVTGTLTAGPEPAPKPSPEMKLSIPEAPGMKLVLQPSRGQKGCQLGERIGGEHVIASPCKLIPPGATRATCLAPVRLRRLLCGDTAPHSALAAELVAVRVRREVQIVQSANPVVLADRSVAGTHRLQSRNGAFQVFGRVAKVRADEAAIDIGSSGHYSVLYISAYK